MRESSNQQERIEERVERVLTALLSCGEGHCDACSYAAYSAAFDDPSACMKCLSKEATTLILFLNGKYLDYEKAMKRLNEQLSEPPNEEIKDFPPYLDYPIKTKEDK